MDRVTHYFDWILIGWVVVSALVTPLVGRFLASRLPDPTADDMPAARPIRHDAIDA